LDKKFENSVIINELKEFFENLPDDEKFNSKDWVEYKNYWIQECEKNVNEIAEISSIQVNIIKMGEKIESALKKFIH